MAYVVSTPRKASDEDEYYTPLPLPILIVYEGSTPTGVLDPYGNEIHAVNDPIGFRFTENETQ